LLVFWGGVQQSYSGFAMNPADSATRVHCPVLMFDGRLDLRVTVDQANNLFNNFAGPRRLELYDHASHCSFLSTDAERWKNAVAATLAQVGKQSIP
jgi:pimeloyl-ACP methyl ester carboxylesterase